MSEKIRVVATESNTSTVCIEMQSSPTPVVNNVSIYEAEKIFERRESRAYKDEYKSDFRRCKLVLHYAALSGAKLEKMYNEGEDFKKLHFVFSFATDEKAQFFSEGLNARIKESD